MIIDLLTVGLLLVAIGTWRWFVVTRRRDMKPKVEVDFGPVGLAAGLAVEIAVRNLDPESVQVIGLAVDLSGPAVGTSRIHLTTGPPGASIPGTIVGYGRGVSWILQSQLPMHISGWSLRAEIVLAHLGQPIYSPRLVWDWINQGHGLGWQLRA